MTKFNQNIDSSFFPAMTRCQHCGRFMKRGIMNYIRHDEDCPSKNKQPPITWVIPEKNIPMFGGEGLESFIDVLKESLIKK